MEPRWKPIGSRRTDWEPIGIINTGVSGDAAGR